MKLFGIKMFVVAAAVALCLGYSATPAHAQAFNVNWSLLATDPYCPHRQNCHEQLHKVYMQAGVTYQIDLTSNQFDTYLILENMNGQLLAQNDDGGIGLNARLIYTPFVSGNYNVVATSFGQFATGSYTLSVVPKNPINPPVVNPPVQPPVQPPVFPGAKPATLNINWSLLNTDPFCPHRQGCREYLHKVYLQAGVTYTIDMKSGQFDTYLILENMNGQVLAQNDDGGGGLNARIIYTPFVSGYYNVVATSFGQNATGAYTLTVLP